MQGLKGNNAAVLAATSATFRRLAQLTGFDHRTVLLGEAGVILKTWAGRTKVSTIGQAERRGRARALYSITYKGRASPVFGYLTVNSGVRGGIPGDMWYRTKRNKFQMAGIMNLKGGGFKWSNLHFPDVDWPHMQAAAQKATGEIKRRIPLARQSVGLSRQSVVQIADSLGIDLLRVQGGGNLSGAGIAKARAALASTGKAYRNGSGRFGGSEVRTYVDLINNLPYGRRLGMDRTLLGVLAGRAKFFERSYAKGAFNSQATAIRAYPNLFRFRSN